MKGINSFSIIKRNPLDILKTILLMVLLGLLAQVVASYLLTVILGFFPEVAKEYVSNIEGLLQFTPGMILLVCVFAPLLEELIFRGLILGILTKFIPFSIANIIQAIVFAVYHGNLVQGIYAFILGAFIGYLMYVTGSFFFTIFFHMGVNIAGLFIDKVIPEETSAFIQLVCAAVALMLGIVIVKTLTKQEEVK